MPVFLLDQALGFPNPNLANEDGLLAVGGDLSFHRLLLAYRNGIFPWFNEEDPTLWWCPNPRFVLFPDELKVSKSMKQVLRKGLFKVTFDQAFENVMVNCQSIKRHGQTGTWITEDLINAYQRLHRAGIAHSVEVWQDDQLVGGLYGVAIGKCFFGESMFAKVSNASKTGFISLVRLLRAKGYQLIDCQMPTPHLESLGARGISRKDFLSRMKKNNQEPDGFGSWLDWVADLD